MVCLCISGHASAMIPLCRNSVPDQYLNLMEGSGTIVSQLVELHSAQCLTFAAFIEGDKVISPFLACFYPS